MTEPEPSETEQGDDPHFAGTILGVRSWLVPPSIDELHPLVKITSWRTDGSRTEAFCATTGFKPTHSPPGKDCECGLYAYHPWSHEARNLDSSPAWNRGWSLAGAVEAWGRIELHREGFRAEFARPVAFLAPPRLDHESRLALERLCQSTGAELIDPATGGASLRGWVNRHPRGLERSVFEELLPAPETGDRDSQPGYGAAPPAREEPSRLGRTISALFEVVVKVMSFLVSAITIGPSLVIFTLIWICLYGGLAFALVQLILEIFRT